MPTETLSAIQQQLVARIAPEALRSRWSDVLGSAGPSDRVALQEVERSGDILLSEVLSSPRYEERFASMDTLHRRAVLGALLKWAESSHEPWRPTAVPIAHPPPTGRTELLRWLMQHDLVGTLDARLEFVAAFTSDVSTGLTLRQSPRATLRDLLNSEGRLSRRLNHPSVQHAVQGFLQYVLGRRQVMAERAIRWAVAPENRELAELSQALRALHEETLDGEPPTPVFVAGSQIYVDVDDGSLVAIVQQRFGARHVQLSLLERKRGKAEFGWEGGGYNPNWVRALCEWGLDAVHNPEHPLHGPIRQVVAKPRWQHLMDELGRALGPTETPTESGRKERLVFRVSQLPGGDLFPEPVIQKQTSRGWSRGRKIDPEQLVRQAGLTSIDRALVERFCDAAGWVGLMFEALVGHPRVVHERDPSRFIAVRSAPVELQLAGEPTARTLRFRVGEALFDAAQLAESLIRPGQLVRLSEDRRALSVTSMPEELMHWLQALLRWGDTFPPEADELLLSLLGRLPASVGLELPKAMSGQFREPDSRPRLLLEPEEAGALTVQVRVGPLGDHRRFQPGHGPERLVGRVEGEPVHTTRQLRLERTQADRAEIELGLAEARRLSPHEYFLAEPEAALDLLSTLAEREDIVAEWPSDAEAWRFRGQVGELRTRVQSAAEWFEVDGTAQVDDQKVELAELLLAVREGRRYVQLGKGGFAAIGEQLKAQLTQVSDALTTTGSSLVVRPEQALAVDAALSQTQAKRDKAFKELVGRIQAAETSEPTIPADLAADLRDYQEAGIRWLLRLASWASGACLADEMGLGKTLQSIAVLLARADLGPALVVAPTSVGTNWVNEAGRFAPSLDVSLYRGPDRQGQLKRMGEGSGRVWVTSYDIVLRDAEALGDIEWGTVVFDEAHNLKNPKTSRTKAALGLSAKFRIGLTGTPLENHLGELWSLFTVLIPGLLGPWPFFRQQFAAPIERDENQERKAALRRKLGPFLLRRTKAQVERELPERTEVVRPVELSPDELALYEAERRRIVRELTEEQKDPKARFKIFAALTRLRRLSCHPRLVLPETNVGSSKLETFLALVDDLRAGRHRALVFSQFVGHLKLVRDALRVRGLDPLYLDGSTPAEARGELVDRFQSGDDPLFLISLKAGGTGLTLTGADTVIQLDPWWNPAVEDQASDRAHRIGQTKPVTVIRLIAQGTVEEKVLALHKRKRDLAEQILEGADGVDRVDTQELIALLNADASDD